jgi:hypothetical protein
MMSLDLHRESQHMVGTPYKSKSRKPPIAPETTHLVSTIGPIKRYTGFKKPSLSQMQLVLLQAIYWFLKPSLSKCNLYCYNYQSITGFSSLRFPNATCTATTINRLLVSQAFAFQTQLVLLQHGKPAATVGGVPHVGASQLAGFHEQREARGHQRKRRGAGPGRQPAADALPEAAPEQAQHRGPPPARAPRRGAVQVELS